MSSYDDERESMKPLPGDKLDPRVKSVWRINDGLWITILMLCLAVPGFVLCSFPAREAVGRLLLLIVAVAYVIMLVVWLIILPPIRYVRWRYEVLEDHLDIAKGIIWRKRYIIPFIRVQNTDTRQGPILRAFGLASVTVSTAAGEHEIPGLDAHVAEVLRDHAAELARIAREDV